MLFKRKVFVFFPGIFRQGRREIFRMRKLRQKFPEKIAAY